MTSSHPWQFFRAGGFDQVRFQSGADYANLGKLDQKLWAALACPVKGLELDETTLGLIDGDGDGRVRAPELIAAVGWLGSRIRDLGVLAKRSDSVALDSLRDDTAEGKALRAAAGRALSELGKAGGPLTLADVTATSAALAAATLNGDGVVPPANIADEAARALAEDVVATVGGVAGLGGTLGVDLTTLGAFHDAARAFTAWQAAPASDPAVMALGDGTAAAIATVDAVRAKVDDFFARCHLAAWDARALATLDRGAEPFAAFSDGLLSASAAEAEALPLAHIAGGRTLPLADGVNPAWAGRIAALREVLTTWRGAPVTELDETTWAALQAALAPYAAWAAARPDSPVAGLAPERLAAAVAETGRAALTELIEADAAVAPELAAVNDLERLVRYHRDLDRLLRNFVSMEEFYSPEPAIFQAGTLFLDSRSCDLCIWVDNAAAHSGLAGASQAYLAYCDLTRPSGEKKSICAAFTDGDSDFLAVGRNGLFYDRLGRDWDARIVKIVANPISVREAFWSPYKKLVSMIEDMVAKRAAAAQAESDAKVGAAATTAANVDKLEAPKDAPKIDIGTVAALGVAVGALGAFFTTLIGYLTGLVTLPFWQVVFVLGGALMLVSGPSMLLAWLKLRQRNLAPMLDANGWAINGRVKMTVNFGKSMTAMAELPTGARADLSDAFGDRTPMWPGLLRFAVIVGFFFSLANTLGLVQMAFDAAHIPMPDVLVQKAPAPEPAAPEAPPAAEAPPAE